MKKYYIVSVGVFTASGSGDANEKGRFTNLKDAKKFFNETYRKELKEIDSWVISKNGYIEVIIESVNHLDGWVEVVETVESKKIYK